MDFPCGKRLAPSLKWLVPKLEQHGELRISKEVREKLLRISAPTVDRLLRSERRKMELKPRAKTKPGTFDVTNVASCWTETEAVSNRAQVWVFEALERIRKRLPFELLGIDFDNDSAFINAHLLRYCQENRITFTRTRSGRKNDNCFVEQKNYPVVRKVVGYMRYDT